MFEKVLSKESKNTLALLGKSGLLKDAHLAGGTALALQIGHRISVDFDFFTRKKFDENIFIQKMKALPIHFHLERSGLGTILGYFNKIRFSLFFYNYPLLAKPVGYLDINVVRIKDIAPMKLAAISARGTKRDFIDLYFITNIEKIFSLEEILDLYDRKFKVLHQNKLHLLKSLSYFDDAEREPIPRMIKGVEWQNVKRYFESEVKKISHKILTKNI